MSTLKSVGLTIALVLSSAAPALAWHISGKVYCDKNGNHTIDENDTKLPNITVKATSLNSHPGDSWTDATDSNGFYSISLHDHADTYRVTIINLPAGWTIIFPSDGDYDSVQLTNSTVSASGKNFLIKGCHATTTTTTSTTTTTTKKTTTTTTTTRPTTTTTSTTKHPTTTTTTTTKPTTTTTTTKPTTTSTTTTTTTTKPPTTTTTTLVDVCECDEIPFLVRTSGKYNNEADIRASLGANGVGGSIQLGRNVLMPDGTSITGDIVRIGPFSNVNDIFVNSLFTGPDVTIRGNVNLPQLPIIDPFCSLPDIQCGSDPVNVPPAMTLTIGPGTYGKVRVANGATLRLQGGTYNVCDIKTGRGASIVALGPVTMNVAGTFTIGTASQFVPDAGQPIIKLNVFGKRVKLAHDTMVAAVIVAPNARLQFGRESVFLGCFCVDNASTDKHITLDCPE